MTSTETADPWLDRDPIACHAQFRPAAVACIELATGLRLTYATLHDRAARAAAWLAGEGVGQGDRVAWLGRNGALQLAVMFGARRLGAVFVPMNWRLSGPELAVIAQDAAPKLFVTDAEFSDCAHQAAAGLPCELLTLEPGGADLSATIEATGPCAAAQVEPDAPFVILYTSGTTGRPKGAVITRRGAFFAAHNFSSVGQVAAGSVVLCDAPMFHTVGLMAVAQTALQSGATVVFTDRFLPDQTLKALADPALGVTHYFAVPQIAQMLREHPDYAPPKLAGLTALFTGGAPMPPSLIEAFLDDGVTLANGYGMTEAGTVLCMPLDKPLVRQRLASAGLVAPAVSLRIVRKDGKDAAVGESGEIWLKGPAVTPGYWNLPEENARCFAPGGWFRSGDAACIDADGYVTLLDRWKDMYITGGENVYPAEVEAALLRIPGVVEAAVIGVPDDKWGECGLAFVVADPRAQLTEQDILTACRAALARYKQPKAVRFLDALPRTASGKVRKDELRKGTSTSGARPPA